MKTTSLPFLSINFPHYRGVRRSLGEASLEAVIRRFTPYHITYLRYEVSTRDTLSADVETMLFHIEERLKCDRPPALLVSAYHWSISHLRALLPKLRDRYPYLPVIVGGPSVSYDLPFRQFLEKLGIITVSGYGERAIRDLLSGNRLLLPEHHCVMPDAETLMASPLIDDIYDRCSDHPNGYLRWESKRGCPYRCAFCQFRSPHEDRIVRLPQERLYEEIDHIMALGIQHLNMVDAIYHMGDQDLELLARLFSRGYRGSMSLQAHLKHLPDEFLELIAGRGVELEIGIQSTEPDILQTLDRDPHLALLPETIERLKVNRVPFKVSLIYGLPGQTVLSCAQMLDNLKALGLREEQILAYPLNLLPGSALAAKKKELKVEESSDLVPRVVASRSFDRRQYGRMVQLFSTCGPKNNNK